MIPAIAQRFDRHAHNYDNRFSAYIGEHELRQIRKLVPPRSQVLDYGCGTGRTTLDLLKRGCTVTAFDISPQMLQRAMSKAAQAGLQAEFVLDPRQIEGRAWPFVTCIGVLDYYPNPLDMLLTLRRFVQPDGRLVVTFPNALNPQAWLYKWISRWTVPATPHTPGYVRQACLQAGLRPEVLLHAFPSRPPLGHTLVLSLSPML